MAHRGTEFLIHHWTASFNSEPLTLSEFLAIKERLIEYMTGLVDAYSRGENWELRPAAVTRRRAQIVAFAI